MLEKSSLPPLPALSHELPEHELRVGQGNSPLLDQCRRQDPPNSHRQVIASKEMRMEQSRESREPGIVAQARNGVNVLFRGRHVCLSALPFSHALLKFGGGRVPWVSHGTCTLRGSQNGTAVQRHVRPSSVCCCGQSLLLSQRVGSGTFESRVFIEN